MNNLSFQFTFFRLPFINLIPIFFICLYSSCSTKKQHRQIEPAFYYWKSVVSLNDIEKKELDTLHVKTLYLKFFDVDWDEAGKKPMPVAKLTVNEPSTRSLRAAGSNNFKFNIIPVIFITNECIEHIDTGQVTQLGNDISMLVFNMIASNAFNDIPEIQFDCDWTATTKDKYFSLLKQFKKAFPQTPLSATIRLHQVKFISKTGVPPVDKGLLMCYNMGNLKNPATKNSILETEELKKYIGTLADYPLPLDVGLPLFSWKVLFRQNQYNGLIKDLADTALNPSFTIQKNNRYELLKDTLLQGYSLKKGDILRSEESKYDEIIAAAGELNKRLKNTHLRVALYHLDSLLLSKYSVHELEAIYNSLR